MNISKQSTYLTFMMIHVIMGVLVYLVRSLALVYFAGSILYFLVQIFRTGNKNNEALMGAAYMVGAEVFFRMSQAIPVYEAGKYSVIAFMLIGLFLSGTSRKSGIYWLYIFLLLPSILVGAMNLNLGANVRNAIFFNLSGPVCLGLSALYCIDRKLTYQQLSNLTRWILLPIVGMSIYITLGTPDLRESLSGTGANYAATGGFGPNQVSTVLGLGMFLTLVQLVIYSKDKIFLFIHLALTGFLLYKGIITFSRGGVIAGLVCSAAFLVIYFAGSKGVARRRMMTYLILLGGVLVAASAYSSFQTNGLINKRYTNRDAAGRLKSDITTGRAELFETELSAFYDNPITGVGAGKSKELRAEETGIGAASHNEVGRLLSEHGVLGLIILAILIIYPLVYRSKNRRNYLFYAALGFWFMTINHSSMRIAAPAFIYALALLNVVHEKKKTPICRQRVIQ
ncbi:O-antigen ligase family protein [Dokdonia sp. Dokd-P16]|uniref:O-antigen ligase family protein n=1 Tax=Dokdonia sp. Dokd-P16 TaxID=2173169 RepID=UPI001EF26A59|nr:O-antigen ligase family protein [Dokdonia sp. Dokd-P16]